MKKLIYFIVILTTSTLPAHSQSDNFIFGKITQKDADLEQYEKDPDAEAVVLFDIGNTYFFNNEGGYDIRFTRTKRIKILNKAGLDYADISVPIYVDGYGKTESIASIEAYTYNIENGTLHKTQLDKKSIFEEIVNERWRLKKFTFPNVQVGSIIEYKIVLETPFLFNTPNWEFQDFIPTIYSEYQISIIPFYEYVFYAQGVYKFDIQESSVSNVDRRFGAVSKKYGVNNSGGVEFNDMVYRFALKDVPAFKDEGYITSVDDYLIKLRFQLAKVHQTNGTTQEIISTWPELKESLLKNQYFGKFAKAAEKHASKVVEQLDISQLTETEKTKKLIDYVKQNYKWNDINSKYTSKSLKNFESDKEGNAAEINLYLLSLLRAAGINAEPVILSTRSNGKIKSNYPFISFFNYVLVLVDVDGQSFLADGTTDLLAYNRIPPRCINEKGLIIDKSDDVNFINLNSKITSTKNVSLNLTFSKDVDQLDVKTRITLTEFEAYRYRNKFQNDSLRLTSYLINEGFTQIDELSTKNYTDKDKPYSMSAQGYSEVEKIDNLIIVKPFLQFPMQSHNLTQKKRTYPVDLIYVQAENFNSTLAIPAGYKVHEIPENTTIENKLATVSTLYTKQGDQLTINATFYLKKATYSSAEYARIKYYFTQMVKEFNREIVLIRNT